MQQYRYAIAWRFSQPDVSRDYRVIDPVAEMLDQQRDLIQREPTVDFALAALSAELELGRGGAWSVFALGRSVGWVAHALEEYGRARLIRPRADYVGPRPGDLRA